MKYENLLIDLVDKVPELILFDKEGQEWFEENLPHVYFGAVVVPFTIKSLEKGGNIAELFHFFEEMALSTDEKVQEVLVTSLLESLVSERHIIGMAKLKMKERTKEFLNDMEKFYGY